MEITVCFPRYILAGRMIVVRSVRATAMYGAVSGPMLGTTRETMDIVEKIVQIVRKFSVTKANIYSN